MWCRRARQELHGRTCCLLPFVTTLRGKEGFNIDAKKLFCSLSSPSHSGKIILTVSITLTVRRFNLPWPRRSHAPGKDWWFIGSKAGTCRRQTRQQINWRFSFLIGMASRAENWGCAGSFWKSTPLWCKCWNHCSQISIGKKLSLLMTELPMGFGTKPRIRDAYSIRLEPSWVCVRCCV